MELTRGSALLRNKKLGSSRTSSNRLRMVRRTLTMDWTSGLLKQTMPNACSGSDKKVFLGGKISTRRSNDNIKPYVGKRDGRNLTTRLIH